MIVVELLDGFGNQIFQYAAGLALNRKTGNPLHINSVINENGGHSNKDYRKYLTNQTFDKNIDRKYIEKNGYVWDTNHNVYEPWNSNSRIFLISENIYIRGYFQYLPPLIPIIQLLRSQMFEQFRKEFPVPPYEKACFIHIRRGDYMSKTTGMTLQNLEYYQNAMQYMESIKPVERWMMVSNDIKWCKEQKWPSNNITYVDEPDEIIQFWKMLHWTEGAVISNSTYSWWAAMLGAYQEESPIIYPKLWHKQYLKPNLFPSEWVAL